MKKTENLYVRLNPTEKNYIKGLAKIYAGGNVSVLIREWILDGIRKYIKRPGKSP